jgi:hypothetical protein
MDNIFFYVLCGINFLLVLVMAIRVESSGEKYRKPVDWNYSGYDYNQENPNALVSGKNIAGTVYALEPGNVPGLGWIL